MRLHKQTWIDVKESNLANAQPVQAETLIFSLCNDIEWTLENMATLGARYALQGARCQFVVQGEQFAVLRKMFPRLCIAAPLDVPERGKERKKKLFCCMMAMRKCSRASLQSAVRHRTALIGPVIWSMRLAFPRFRRIAAANACLKSLIEFLRVEF